LCPFDKTQTLNRTSCKTSRLFSSTYFFQHFADFLFSKTYLTEIYKNGKKTSIIQKDHYNKCKCPHLKLSRVGHRRKGKQGQFKNFSKIIKKVTSWGNCNQFRFSRYEIDKFSSMRVVMNNDLPLSTFTIICIYKILQHF